MRSTNISQNIFRAYDIRGVYGEDISPDVFYRIGLGTGQYLRKVHGKKIAVGNDIRQTSYSLTHAFLAGLTASGIHVSYVGTTSFGQTLFKGWKTHQDLIVFVTASHLPPEWNGIKFYYGDGVGLPEKELLKIRDFTCQKRQQLVEWRNTGTVRFVDASQEYKSFFQSKFRFRKNLRIAVDCGGGSITLAAPEIFSSLGLDLVPVFCEPDPAFSNRPSDPKPQNLTELVKAVTRENCDFGVAFDGDGDRSVIVDNKGKILSADETGIIIGKYGLANQKGTIIANVECSKAVSEQLTPLGFKVKQIQVGHTFLTLHAKREHAPLGIESSGHIILPEYFLFDDALVVPLKIAEILDQTNQTLASLRAQIPTYPTGKEEIPCSDDLKFSVVEELKQELEQEFNNLNTLDGVRVELDRGWALIRPSNTSPLIRLTVEADTEKIVKEITSDFKTRTEKLIKKH